MTFVVSFCDCSGQVAAIVTIGEDIFDVCHRALARFDQADWRGPRPASETELRVQPVSREERYSVRVAQVRAWAAQRAEPKFLKD